MKRLIILVPLALLLISKEALAQVKCTIPCWEQSFLYQFCPHASPIIVLGCSTDPNDDPHGTPVKAYVPGLVAIFNESTIDTLWQPSTSVPAAPPNPNLEAIYLGYLDSSFCYPPWEYPYDEDSGFWEDDYTEYEAALSQWNLDSIKFFNRDFQEMTDTMGMDSGAVDVVNIYYGNDYLGLYNVYYNEEFDSTVHANGDDVSYVQPWNDAQADSDAQHALDNWLHTCDPPLAPDGPTCTIHIILDPTVSDWSSGQNPDPKDILAATNLPQCGEASCADLTRFTKVNTSPAFLYQSNTPSDWHPNPKYKLHAAPTMIWYTGTGLPLMPNIYYYGGYKVISFYQLMEHEIGHWLGLEHPEWGPSNTADYSCLNCYTNNPYFTDSNTYNDSGFHTVMAQVNNIPNDTALLLTNEDSCQFKKLYCEADLSVKLGPNETDWFNPLVFPNPSNGGMTLAFTTIERSFTQVAIYDMLGKNVMNVVSGYSDEGPQSISLGTESLPSGNYVCRVRVGDRVSYINLAITK
jgi:hypothetical protein